MGFHRQSLLVTLLVGLTFLPSTARLQSPQKQGMVRERLLSDIRNIQKRLTNLNETVKELKNDVNRLRDQNQRQKNRIQALEKGVKSLSKQSISETRSKTKNAVSGPSKPSAPQNKPSVPEIEKGDTVWETRPYLNYKVRRTPLDRELLYVATDDTMLTKLAHRYYRDASYWKHIYRVNSDKLPSPNVVPPGTELRLPPVGELK